MKSFRHMKGDAGASTQREIADEEALRTLIRSRLLAPAPEQLRLLAQAAAARHGAEDGVRTVLAYGSTLRGASFAETLADLYVLTRDFAHVSTNPFARLGCRLLPPNVYYLALPQADGPALRAKYAVLPLAQFRRWLQPDTDNPYFWARFAQPSRLVWRAEPREAKAVEDAIVDALFTALTTAALITPAPRPDWRQLWTTLLHATYRTELRVESARRPQDLITADEDWYRGTVKAMFGATEDIVFPAWLEGMRGRLNWNRIVWQGKLLTVLRLAKAAFTFAGGADYIAFKIERHTGEHITLTDWQRRHPLLTGLLMLPKLLRKGLVK